MKYSQNNLIINFVVILTFLLIYLIYDNLLNKLLPEIKNTHNEIEYEIENKINSISFLKTTLEINNQNKKILPLKYINKIHTIDDQGNYALDIATLPNLTGFGSLKRDEDIQLEMESALRLNKYLETVKASDKTFKWIYYASMNNFLVMYPFVHSKEFTFNKEQITLPFFSLALPKNNPAGKLFFTPLYIDGVAGALMVTIGQPIYENSIFRGTLNIDLTLASLNRILNFDNVHDGSYFITDQSNNIMAGNNIPEFREDKVYSSQSLVPQDVLNIVSTDDKLISSGLYFTYVKSLKGTPWKMYYYKSKFDIFLDILLYTFPLLLILVGLFKIKNLVTKLYMVNNRLDHLATHDVLTGLPNRALLEDRLNQMIKSGERHNRSFAVFFLDIDYFKSINDSFGHNTGDKVLQIFSKIILGLIREEDTLARLGGDEFILLVNDVSEEDSSILAKKILKSFDKKLLIDENEIKISSSIGIALFPNDAKNTQELLHFADTALYKAKGLGRNNFQYN